MADLIFKKMKEVAGEFVSEGSLSDDELSVTEDSRGRHGGDLFDILVARGYVTEEEFLHRLGKKLGLASVSLVHYQPAVPTLQLISAVQARRWYVIPLFQIEERVTIATADPYDLTIRDEVREAVGRDVDFVVARRGDIAAALDRYYKEGTTAAIPPAVIPRAVAELAKEARGTQAVLLVDQLLEQAYRDRASDLHIEPTRDTLKVRFRIDGILEEFQTLAPELAQTIISRVKILGGMDVAERRVPQDGRVRRTIDGQEIDLRIATFPTMFGEAAAVRLLAKEQLMTLADIGFSSRDQELFTSLVTRPHGLVVVTGPTGCGKSTTLYAALLQINRHDQHVLSVEDPIEHEIEGVKQTQINVRAGVTFPTAIRAMLRQDPDVIMVGEIRDRETAEMSLRAAMTGHLVLTTLHTNSALGTFARLIDVGVEPYLISATISGVVAQRLVRRVCHRCVGRGCRECRMTGFRGRVGLFELVRVNDALRELIGKKVSETQLAEALRGEGYHTLTEDGREKIQRGITTVDEVRRATESS